MTPIKLVTLFLLSASMGSLASCQRIPPRSRVKPPSTSARVGIYHWGGVATRGITDGVRRIVAMRSDVARITISPNYRTDYNVGTGCEENYSLLGMLDNPDVRMAVFYPGLTTLLITAYDSSFETCSVHNYLNPEWYTPENTAGMVAEYAAFTEELMRGSQGLRRTYVLLNWEGDNAVYCGGSYTFSLDEGFRRDCLARYPLAYHNDTPQESLHGMALWMAARAAGVAQGLAAARQSGLHGSTVLTALEISGPRFLEEAGWPSVLDTIARDAPVDLISYSAYESINLENPGVRLLDDLRAIAAVSGKRVLIGEFGFNRAQWGDATALARTIEVLDAALASDAPWIIYWNLYDQAAEKFGLYDELGEITETGRLLRRRFVTQ